MKIIIANDYDEVSRLAYGVIKNTVLANPNAVLGLATGSSPVGIYKLMAEDCARGEVSYKNVKTVNLDEYVGLPKDHEQSYKRFMQDNLFNRIDILPENTHLPDGTASDLQAECSRYDALVASLKPDVQLLGIGRNGHIAFNEPGTPFDSNTHTITLEESTRVANAKYFSSLNEVPRKAITLGIKGIMSAKRLLLVANGTEKSDAIARALGGPVDESCPASILQKHGDVVVVLDKNAASKLKF